MIDKLTQLIERLRYHVGMSLSVFLHLSLFALLLVNFPQCQRKLPPEIIISVDLLPISKMTNVENKQVAKPKKEEKLLDKPKPIEEPKKEVKEEPKPEPKPETKPELKPEPIPDKPKPEPKPIEQPKLEPVAEKPKPKKEEKRKPDPTPKKEPEKKKKPIKKPKVNEYDSLMKDLLEVEQKNDQNEEVADKYSKGPHNADIPLSMSIKDSIKKQIEKCWSPPVGNIDAGKLAVLLNITFGEDGSATSVKIKDSFKYNSDELYRVAADAAVRAVHKCSPLQGLPVDQYSSWQNIEFNFDPSNLIY